MTEGWARDLTWIWEYDNLKTMLLFFRHLPWARHWPGHLLCLV